MLKFTPGVLVTNGTDITVLGEGKPVIYINGREVKNLEELRAYQSTNASSIEVIRQPDAQYDASVSCIIRITLRETYKDYMGLNVSNATEVKNRISNTTNLNYLVNKGIFQVWPHWDTAVSMNMHRTTQNPSSLTPMEAFSRTMAIV